MKVLGFRYNGITARIAGIAEYTAEFIKWTDDPGIAVCQCSDGKSRNIPTCCLVGFIEKEFPNQILPDYRIKELDRCGIIVGSPSEG